MKLKFTNPILPIGEIRITDEFSRSMPRLEKLKKCMDFYRANGRFDRQIIVDSGKTLHDGYCAYLTAYLLGVEKVGVLMVGEEAEPIKAVAPAKPEPMKLYCTKDSDPGVWLTKGKIYEAAPGFCVKYDNGFIGGPYDSIEQFKDCCPSAGAPLFPLVSRPAKVEEWVLVTDSIGSAYKSGEIYKVFGTGTDGCIWFADDCNGNIKCGNYLVLDGYTGDAE